MRFRAGSARVCITPPVGSEISGWAFGASRGVHDDLWAKVLVLAPESAVATEPKGALGSTGGRSPASVPEAAAPLVIVTADLIGLESDFAGRLRAGIARLVATHADRVLVACSHTHSGPATMPLRRWGTLDRGILADIEAKILGAVEEARDSLAPARLGRASALVPGIAVNRRRDDVAAVDERLSLFSVRRDDGTSVAVVLNFACHPVAAHGYENLISADFPGFAMSTVEVPPGPGGVAMFTLGAAGDVNPVAFHHMDYAAEYGNRLGAAALGLLDEMPMRGDLVLSADTEGIDLPVRALPPIEDLLEEAERWEKEADRLQVEGGRHDKREDALIKAGWARETIEVVREGSVRSHIHLDLFALALGDAAILACPAELFARIGLNIQAASPFPATLIVTLANGSLCYIPTREAFASGGYETDFASKVYGLYLLTPEAQDLVEAGARRLLDRLFHSHPTPFTPGEEQNELEG